VTSINAHVWTKNNSDLKVLEVVAKNNQGEADHKRAHKKPKGYNAVTVLPYSWSACCSTFHAHFSLSFMRNTCSVHSQQKYFNRTLCLV